MGGLHTDLDSQFIFLWIAFNAAYANRDLRDDGFTEKAVFRQFLHDLLALDRDGLLKGMVWQQYPQAIRVLLDNPYVYQPFWDAQASAQAAEWEDSFQADKQKAHRLLSQGDTTGVVCVVLNRLYTLRNQILHGGATWNSQVNRDQLRDAVSILTGFVPVVITLLMHHPDHGWSEPLYPVVR